MEKTLPGILSKYRWRVLFCIVALPLGALLMLVLVFNETLYGLYKQKMVRWEEDAFVGQSFTELENLMAKRGESLVPVDSYSFFAITDRRLQKDQRAMQFVKGESYSWFHVGTAVNVGYVVVEKGPENERVVEIFHRRSVDAP